MKSNLKRKDTRSNVKQTNKCSDNGDDRKDTYFPKILRKHKNERKLSTDLEVVHRRKSDRSRYSITPN